ncbi:hypothetical protein P3T76_000877 [Phytophthora citrophthora]|uniref:Uncharacterized protein n=1 Tax=Phytophthora citrophthora TaxID=4793 RepID=A0AAD9H2M3_9STRA|nr:hypothetical protein P3T76_000877 [Phytophthora citrophthora]
MVKSRKTAQRKFIKVVNANCEVRPLADILQLSDTNVPEYNEDHTVAQWRDSNNWDATILKEVVAFYVTLLLNQLSRSGGVKTTRFRVCFRMARDLALLQNDFYIDELQKVYDAKFKDKSIDLAHCGLETFKYEEQLNLELFLEKLVRAHPSYRQCIDSKQPLDPLNWLARCHLQPQVRLHTKSRGRTKQSTSFWIWEPMPADMDVALEKLLPSITKYMRVLGQFFLREAVRSSSTADKPKDYRISSTAFISLMKQVRVFPQLFHRRELENAVRLSCQSAPDTEELNFPEFIEALVHCSCNLRWGELDGGKHVVESNNDTVVVIKFVMLIFAMEGHGSVLKKRSEDVGAILEFLGQQQKRNQAEKLFRFRKMLADNKRRGRTSRSRQSPSVWNQIRLQFSSRSCPTRSSTRSQDTFDELTESWDGGSPRRVYTEPFVFDAQTNEPFDLDEPPSPVAENQQSQPISVQLVENAGSNGCIDETNLSPTLSKGSLPPTFAVDTVGEVTGTSDEAIQQVSAASLNCQTPAFCEENDASDHTSAARTIDGESTVLSEQHLTTEVQSPGLVDPMEKDDFLREIMDNIGDVELLLSQARFNDTKKSKDLATFLRLTATHYPFARFLGRQLSRKTFPSDSIQYATSVECVPSLSELAEDSHWQPVIFSSNTDAASEVQVRDPMLNYLTDIERFTESAGTIFVKLFTLLSINL